MAEKLFKMLFFILSLRTITCSEVSPMQESGKMKVDEKEQIFPSSHRENFNKSKSNATTKTVQHGAITPPTTNPVMRLATFQSTNPAAKIVSIPSTDPITLLPTKPVTNPDNTNPVPSSGGIPLTTVSPEDSEQCWCVAKAGALDASLQVALDYACGTGGADCSAIQETRECYIPNTIHSHASYAFNSYYGKNPVPSSCDFGGTAMLVYLNPSSEPCIYPSSSTSSSSMFDTSNPTSSSIIYGSGPHSVYSDCVSTLVDLKFLATFLSLTTSCIMGIPQLVM